MTASKSKDKILPTVTPTTSSGSNNSNRKFFVVDNNEPDGVDNSWSLILTDDESRSTSSEESASIRDVDAENIFSDDSDEDDFLTGSENAVIVDDHNVSSATKENESKSAVISRGIADYFQLPTIDLSSKATNMKFPQDWYTSPYFKAFVGFLVLAMTHLLIPYPEFLVDPKSSNKSITLLNSNFWGGKKEVYTTVLVQTTETKTVQLPRETVTVDRFGFQVPDYIKNYYSTERRNAIEILNNLYEEDLKNSIVVDKAQKSVDFIQDKFEEFKSNHESFEKEGKDYFKNIYSKLSKTSKLYQSDLFGRADSFIEDFWKFNKQASIKVQDFYENIQPEFSKTANKLKTVSFRTSKDLETFLKNNFNLAKGVASSYEYSKEFEKAQDSVKTNFFKFFERTKKNGNDLYSSKSVQSAISLSENLLQQAVKESQIISKFTINKLKESKKSINKKSINQLWNSYGVRAYDNLKSEAENLIGDSKKKTKGASQLSKQIWDSLFRIE